MVAWLGAVLALISGLAHGAGQALEIGVFPSSSAHATITLYQPLQQWLEKSLKHPVRLYSAGDFKSFVQATQRGEYDLVVTAPHFARLAQTDAGYRPILAYETQMQALFVVRKNAPLHSLRDLAGKTIAIPDRLAIMPMMGIEQLRQVGIDPDHGARMHVAHTHNNAALSVQNGSADAAIVGSSPFRRLPKELQSDLRIIARSASVPGVYFLAHPRITAPDAKAIDTALRDFAASPAGKRFLENAGHGGFIPVREKDLKSMEPYAREAKRLLDTTP